MEKSQTRKDAAASINSPPYLSNEEMKSFKTKYRSITNFMQDPQLNIGFFIGSSGSGKYYLTLSYLESNNIPYMVYPTFNYNQSIDQFCGKVFLTKEVIICRQFFPSTFLNCNIFYQTMKEYNRKLIFILNSCEYSYKSIQKFIKVKNSGQIYQLSTASFNQFAGYTKTQMKNLISTFGKKTGYNFKYSPDVLTELVQLHSGDSRRILNQLFLRNTITTHEKVQSTNANKISIFHFLGKLLYNKRLVEEDSGLDKKDAKRCEKGYYRQMTCEELIKYDPPFYFDPVELMKQSYLSFEVIVGFLSENFRSFYCSIEDNIKFGYLLSVLYKDNKQSFKHSWKVEQEFDNLKYVLLSHGVMIYNLHGSQRKNGFVSLLGPKAWQYDREQQVKMQILRRNIPELSLQQMFELRSLSQFFPDNMYPIVSIINKIMNVRANTDDKTNLNQNQQIVDSNDDVSLNRKAILPRNKYVDYEEISSDQN